MRVSVNLDSRFFVCIFSRQCDPAAAVSCPTRAHRGASGAMSGCRFVPLGRIDVLMLPCLCLCLFIVGRMGPRGLDEL